MVIRRTFWGILFILVISLIGAIWFQPDVRIYSQIVFLLVLLIISSFIWTFFSLRGILLKRYARSFRQQLGQVFEERFEIINRLPIPRVYIEIRDLSEIPGIGGSKVIAWLPAKEIRNYIAYTYLSKRGEFTLGPTELYASDPFGLFSFTMNVPDDRCLLVLPHLFDLQSFPLPPGFLPGGRALRRKTSEVTPHAAGVREYMPGDSLNRIHWATTARRNKIMVKEFEQDPMADVWILLDGQSIIQASLHNGYTAPDIDQFWLLRNRIEITLPPDTFEYGVCIAASTAQYFIRRSLAVGFACAGQSLTVLSSERGERQLNKILEMLALLKCEGELPMLGLVEAQAPHLPRGSTVVLITSSVLDNIALSTDELVQRNLRPVVVLVDPSTFGSIYKTEKIAANLATRRIPYVIVSRGADIKQTLENGFSYIPRGY